MASTNVAAIRWICGHIENCRGDNPKFPIVQIQDSSVGYCSERASRG